MSGFIENLLSRHREGSVDTGAVSLVQPRSKARFESDLGPTVGTGAFSTYNDLASPIDVEQATLSPLPDNQSDMKSLIRSTPVMTLDASAEFGTDKQSGSEAKNTQHQIPRTDFLDNRVLPVVPEPSLAFPEQKKDMQESAVPVDRGKTGQGALLQELFEPAGQRISPPPFSDPDGLGTEGLARKKDIVQPGILQELHVQPPAVEPRFPSQQQQAFAPENDEGGVASQQFPVQPVVTTVHEAENEQQPFIDEFKHDFQRMQHGLTALHEQEEHKGNAQTRPPEQSVSGRETGPFKSNARQAEKGIHPNVPQPAEQQRTGQALAASELDQRIQEILHRFQSIQRQDVHAANMDPEQKILRTEDGATDNRVRQSSPPRVVTEKIGEKKHGQLSSAAALNRQLQPLLHRLNNEQGQEGRKVPARPGLPLSTNETSAPTTRRNVPPESPTGREKSKIKDERKQQQERHPIPSESAQAGVLQTPAWLAATQAELHNRRQKNTPQSGSEPVINVSIGRVEVRAVQTKSATKPKNSQKTSGIMSLDDYLKQRENRGRI